MKAQDLLPDGQNQLVQDGVVVRKGTVAAFLINARTWGSTSPGSAERVAAEADMVDALPALRTLGLFEVLAIRDNALRHWIEAQ